MADSIYRGVLAAYILGWVVSVSGLWCFFLTLEKDNVPPFWHPLYDFCTAHFGGCLICWSCRCIRKNGLPT